MTTTIQKKDFAVIQTYGNSDDVYSLARRIKAMVPGGSKLTDSEAQALAQVSLVTQCNPFIGEIWYIPGRGPMIGIKGARRHGNEEIEKAGGLGAYWTPDLQICTPEEAGAGGVKDVAFSYRCIITDSVSTTKYQKLFLETVNSLRAAGDPDPVGTAREICGKRPVWVGFGYSTHSEQTKMSKQAAARKRAEADALKQRFDIPFGTEVAAGDNAQEIEASWTEVPPSNMAGTIDEEFPKPETGMTYEHAHDTIVKTSAGERLIGELSIEQLNKVYESKSATDIQRQAVEIILKADFQAEPPKFDASKALGDMGFNR